MTESDDRNPKRNRRIYCCATLAVLLLILLILLILFLTLLKPKDPETQILSTTVEGISPRISFPRLRIELNITLSIVILVHNPNRYSFRSESGNSYVFYRGEEIGVADLMPSRIPADGSVNMTIRMTLEADKLITNTNIIGDVMAGAVMLETNTRIPGRVTILGIFRRHAVALVKCQVMIGFPDLAIRRQDCEHKTKF